MPPSINKDESYWERIRESRGLQGRRRGDAENAKERGFGATARIQLCIHKLTRHQVTAGGEAEVATGGVRRSQKELEITARIQIIIINNNKQ